MGQRMNEENQEQDQKDEIAGKQEEPGQIVSEKVEKKPKKKTKEKASSHPGRRVEAAG